MYSFLDQDITYLKGVGQARAQLLASELDIHTVADLLHHYPFRHEDRTRTDRIDELHEGTQHIQLRGQIIDVSTVGEGPKRRLMATFTDGTGFITLIWFRSLKTISKMCQIGVTYQIFGEPKIFQHSFSIPHPEMEAMEKVKNRTQLRMQPVYHLTEKLQGRGITSKFLNQLVANAFDKIASIPETLSSDLITAHRLVSHEQAIRDIHFSQSAEAVSNARRRLKFEELFFLQLSILQYARSRQTVTEGWRFPRVAEKFNAFYSHVLPFSLTEAQKRVIREIHADLKSGHQMNRLLQGDVGSGKTIVAALVVLLAIDNGFQACIMAPTEILPEQHYRGLCDQMQQIGVNVALLTGNVKGKQRRKTLEGIKEGSISILVGTHALIEPNVEFRNLGLAVIDEQHRFGVKQRAQLWTKNSRPPHILVMTATPIPRTLAMTVYGDLDVSVIDQLPPGRKPIATRHYASREYERIRQGVEAELRRGRQVYIVYPLIKENEKLDLKALEEGYEETQRRFPQWKVGMVHGKMKPAEKDAAMKAFAANETQILVSTTVIEVGVNVPNASVMIVENAERFGLAQLHQLRGRVGRGAEQSYCILVTKDQLAENTHERMQILVETNDGFRIAEADLKFRGPGDLEGTAQSGLPIQLKMASLVGDSVMMSEAREAANRIIEADPGEQLPQYRVLWTRLRQLKANHTNYSDIT